MAVFDFFFGFTVGVFSFIAVFYLKWKPEILGLIKEHNVKFHHAEQDKMKAN